MTIETERLELVLLNVKQLELWINDIRALEKELNCVYAAEPMQGVFLDIVKNQYNITLKDSANCIWHSFFFLIRKTDRAVVGSSDFKDIPRNSEVEIGYGLGKQFEHNGYMTEAVKAMCSWAFANDVNSIVAETYTDNAPSQNILKRCGFTIHKQAESLWWRLDNPKA